MTAYMILSLSIFVLLRLQTCEQANSTWTYKVCERRCPERIITESR